MKTRFRIAHDGIAFTCSKVFTIHPRFFPFSSFLAHSHLYGLLLQLHACWVHKRHVLPTSVHIKTFQPQPCCPTRMVCWLQNCGLSDCSQRWRRSAKTVTELGFLAMFDVIFLREGSWVYFSLLFHLKYDHRRVEKTLYFCLLMWHTRCRA